MDRMALFHAACIRHMMLSGSEITEQVVSKPLSLQASSACNVTVHIMKLYVPWRLPTWLVCIIMYQVS